MAGRVLNVLAATSSTLAASGRAGGAGIGPGGAPVRASPNRVVATAARAVVAARPAASALNRLTRVIADALLQGAGTGGGVAPRPWRKTDGSPIVLREAAGLPRQTARKQAVAAAAVRRRVARPVQPNRPARRRNSTRPNDPVAESLAGSTAPGAGSGVGGGPVGMTGTTGAARISFDRPNRRPRVFEAGDEEHSAGGRARPGAGRASLTRSVAGPCEARMTAPRVRSQWPIRIRRPTPRRP
jgi:hypothetical protein